MKDIRQLKIACLKSLKPQSKLSVSEWADTFGQISSDSAEPGKYHTSRTPYMKAVMDAFTEPDINRIVVKSAAQIGKSTVLMHIVGRTAHLAPCNVMIIQPTLEMAQDFQKRVSPNSLRTAKS